MIFRKLFGGGWPKGIPRLYPLLDGPELCDFLDRDEFEQIKQSQLVMVCPFFSEARSDDHELDTLFGAGLARLMIRDLMLIKNISVRGPEDTSPVPNEYIDRVSSSETKQNTMFITGECRIDGSNYLLYYEIWQSGQLISSGEVTGDDFLRFLRECAETLGREVGGDITADLDESWSASRPKDAKSLAWLGQLCLGYHHEEGDEVNAQIQKGIDMDPGFALFHSMMTEDKTLAGCLRAYELDPFDAQCCFNLFIAIWKSDGTYEPEAVQFIRRATRLSPGHGKAHMCAPHAAHPDRKPKMLRHSELGYLLLPGNPFAINNYVINLSAANAPTEKLLELAKEGIANDPSDPGNYQRMIQLFVQNENFKTALLVAEELHKLYEPVMDERALYCLKQNPKGKEMLESGEWDPAKENRELMEKLRAAIQ